jgi:PAS domain S-box-containing protein
VGTVSTNAVSIPLWGKYSKREFLDVDNSPMTSTQQSEPENILIIDDTPNNLRLLASLLSAQGYSVRLATSASLAFMTLQEDLPDLILLDILMPEMDGYEVCQKLKTQPRTAEIPVIFMTALADTENKVKGFQLGAVDYITKPIQQEEVVARVRLHLKMRHLTKTLDAQNKQLQGLTQELEQRVLDRTKALKESEACLRQLTENIASVLWLANADKSEMLYVSSAYEKLWKRSCEKLYESPDLWLEAIHPDDIGQVMATLGQQIHEKYDREYRIILPDGTIRWVRDRAFPIRDESGQVYRIAGIAEDITERRHLEEVLRLQERAIAASSNGIVILDAQQPNYPISFVNPAFEQITGYSEAEVIGCNWWTLLGQDFHQQELSVLRQALDTQQSCTVNLRNYRKDGQLFWNELSVAPIYDGQGHLTNYIGIQTDITERKQAEISLQRSLHEKELLLKEIHHRVKNNLLVVSSLLELQTDYLEDPQAVQCFEDSQNRIKSIALVHEKLYQSKNLAQIDFAEYLELLLNHLCDTFDAYTRQIEVEFSADKILLNLETVTPCGLIVSELISNVFKHAFPNQKAGKLWLTARQDAEKLVTILVRDNGIGLPEELDICHTDSLGLQLVCLLAKQLECDIQVFRHQGTAFQLQFSELRYKERL